MTALLLTMTTAGLGRFTAAQTDNGVDLTVTHVALSNTSFTAAPTLTSLPGEFRRVHTVSGVRVADNIVHMTVQDDEALAYTVRGFGLFLGDGTLFATYSQPVVLVEKSIGSTLAFAIDIAFPEATAVNIRFGDTNFLNPPASTEIKGVVELATLAEANAGDATRATTGAIVKAMIASAMDMVSQALTGLTGRTIYGSGLVKGGGDLTGNRTLTVDAASSADVFDGTRGDIAVTPASLAPALGRLTNRKISGAGLVKGGGDLSGDRTLSVDAASADEVRAGVRGDAVITPAGLAALAGSIATTGEFQIAPGVFVKIGLKQGPFGEGAVTIDFPSEFPNECLIAVPIVINARSDIRCDSYAQERALTRSSFTAFVQKQASDSTNIDAIRWIAVGR